MKRLDPVRIFTAVALLLTLAFAAWLQLDVDLKKTAGEDVYYSWVEGNRIAHGENPYGRVLEGDMRTNHKYATYLPMFYLLSSLTQIIGFEDYLSWITAWRLIFLVCNLGIGIMLFQVLSRRTNEAFALFGMALWFFNRWTLYVVQVAHLDFVPIFMLIASMILMKNERPFWSLIIFSMSLAFKQIAIFLVPIYLIAFWHTIEKRSPKQVMLGGLALGTIPCLLSLPFLIWNAEGFVKSILFSATRTAATYIESTGGLYSIETWFGLEGFGARLPMLTLIMLLCWPVWKKQIGFWTGALLTMTVFIAFNSMLYQQYVCWIFPLLCLAAVESNADRSRPGYAPPATASS